MSDELTKLLKASETAIRNSDLAAAKRFCLGALAIDPQSLPALYDLGYILNVSGDPEGALEHFSKILEIDDKHYHANHGSLMAYVMSGNHDKAHKQCLKMIEQNPEDPLPYTHLSRSKTYKNQDDDDIYLLLNHLEKYGKNKKLREDILFALAKIFDDLKEYDKAFEFCDEANNIHYKYNPVASKTALEKYYKTLCSTFDADFFKERQGWGDKSKKPVFVIGMPRSGTTLTEQILSRHPDIYGKGELNLAEDMLNSVPEKLRSSISFPGCLLTASKSFFADIAQEYWSILSDGTGGAHYIVDKMPHNFWHLGFLHLLFPNAKFIHCKRDPMDIGLSLYFCKFSGDNEFAYNLKEIGDYYGLYNNIMRHWNEALPTEIHEIKYENLVSDTQNEARDLLEFCGVSWDERCLTPHKNKSTINTASIWQARQPIYNSSVNKWKNYENHLGELKKSLADIS